MSSFFSKKLLTYYLNVCWPLGSNSRDIFWVYRQKRVAFLSVSLCNLSTSIVIGFTSTRRRLRRFFFWPPTSDVFKLGRSSKFKSWSPESSRCKGSDIVISTVTYAKFAILRFWHFFIGYFGVTFGQSVFELLHWSQRLSQIGRPNCSQFAAGRQRQGHLLFGS